MTRSRAVHRQCSQPDAILHAAIRLSRTGRVLVGKRGESHAMLWELAAEQGLVGTNSAGHAWLDEIEDGFVTSSGRFVNREEALHAALKAGQIAEADCAYIEAQNGGPGLELFAFEERRHPGVSSAPPPQAPPHLTS